MKKLLLILLCLPVIGFGQCTSGDCENGYGTLTYASGSKYVGEFKDGSFNGQGTYTSSDGGKYVGEWKDDGLRLCWKYARRKRWCVFAQ